MATPTTTIETITITRPLKVSFKYIIESSIYILYKFYPNYLVDNYYTDKFKILIQSLPKF